MVICMERGADLHMAQLMPLPLTVSVKSRLVLPFWYRLTRVVPEKGRKTGVCVCVRVCVNSQSVAYGVNVPSSVSALTTVAATDAGSTNPAARPLPVPGYWCDGPGWYCDLG